MDSTPVLLHCRAFKIRSKKELEDRVGCVDKIDPPFNQFLLPLIFLVLIRRSRCIISFVFEYSVDLSTRDFATDYICNTFIWRRLMAKETVHTLKVLFQLIVTYGRRSTAVIRFATVEPGENMKAFG